MGEGEGRGEGEESGNKAMGMYVQFLMGNCLLPYMSVIFLGQMLFLW